MGRIFLHAKTIYLTKIGLPFHKHKLTLCTQELDLFFLHLKLPI